MVDPVDIGIAVAIAIASLGSVFILATLARGLVKKWTGDKPALNDGEVAELRQRVGELGAEVAELHERLDFTERVLANQPDAPRGIGPASSEPGY